MRQSRDRRVRSGGLGARQLHGEDARRHDGDAQRIDPAKALAQQHDAWSAIGGQGDAPSRGRGIAAVAGVSIAAGLVLYAILRRLEAEERSIVRIEFEEPIVGFHGRPLTSGRWRVEARISLLVRGSFATTVHNRAGDIAHAAAEALALLGPRAAHAPARVRAEKALTEMVNRSLRRRVVRALEVTIGSGVPFSAHGPGLEHYPELPWPIVGLDVPRDALDVRIAERYRRQLADGFVEEVRTLAARPGGLSATARQALGYRELLEHVEDGVPLDECVEVAVRRTRRFARRQQRWFRRDPRIRWVDAADPDDPALVATVRSALGW